jgi:hypothetical protein
MKCKSCGSELTEDTIQACIWYQGRCPHQPSMLDNILANNYKSRFYNLLNWFKGNK